MPDTHDVPISAPTKSTSWDATIEQHRIDLAAQPQGREAATKATAQRNAAIETITCHRIALQYAADRAYPPGDPLMGPSRKRFHFDPDKGLGETFSTSANLTNSKYFFMTLFRYIPKGKQAIRVLSAIISSVMMVACSATSHQDHIHESYEVLRLGEQGELIDPEKLKKLCRRVAREQMTVVAYIHGWKNDDRPDNSNVRGFHNALCRVNERTFKPTGRKLLGLYITWDARELPSILENTKYLSTQKRADTIALGSGLPTIIRALSSASSNRGKEKLVFVGHSMGARILGRVLGRSPSLLYGIDLALLINAAEDVEMGSQVAAAVSNSRLSREGLPKLVWVTSKADYATGTLFKSIEGKEAIGHAKSEQTHLFDGKQFIELKQQLPMGYRNVVVGKELMTDHGDIWRDTTLNTLNYCLWKEPY